MTLQLPDVSKTLEQLDGQHYGEPEWQSHLVLECHRLHRIPLRAFFPADLRIMIGQSMSLEFLVPLALLTLADDPLLDAEYYPGDLLNALLQSDVRFWSTNPDLRATLATIAEEAVSRLDALDESERGTTEQSLYDNITRFQRSAPTDTVTR